MSSRLFHNPSRGGSSALQVRRAPIGISVVLLLLLALSAWCRTTNAIWWNPEAADSLHRLHYKHCPEGSKHNSSLHLCKLSGGEISSLMRGAAKGIYECQMQASTQRWNCSSSNWNIFLGKLHKEAAYVHAIISIAVSAQLVKDCNNGLLPSTTICGGSPSCQGSSCTKEIISYGYNTAKILDWIHSPEQLDSMKWRQALVHNHNRDAGRFIVKKQIRKRCKCNGVSGSCLENRCYHRLPEMSEMIRGLMDNKVFLPWKENRNRVQGSLKSVRGKRGKTFLVYMKRSPSYCCSDPSQGTLGTEGRSCNGQESCRKVCCSKEVEQMGSNMCNCKFHFCCRLQCEECRVRMYRCMAPTCETNSRSRDD